MSNSTYNTDEERYAILIGIDDYEDRTLDYASSDASSMRDVLVERCAVHESRTYPIISSTANPKRESYAELERVIRTIREEFRPRRDSIIFYFAGHGEQHFGVSNLLFHENQVPLGSIAELLKPLEARFLTCIIDACESGSFEGFRGAQPIGAAEPAIAERLIESSQGICVISSCTGDEKARERESLGHGVFTHFLLDVITDDANYDEDGILSIHRIAEKVGKGTITSTKFQQHPVADLRSTGFYPFAFLRAPEITSPSHSTPTVVTQASAPNEAVGPAKEPAILEDKFPMVSPEHREQEMNAVKTWFAKERSRLFQSLEDDQYEIDHGEDLEAFRNIRAAVDEQIVVASRTSKIEAAGEIFSSRKEEDPLYQLWPNSVINLFMREEQKYSIRFDIDWSKGYVFGSSIAFHSNKANLPSMGFGFIVYQAKYGMGLAIVSYTTTWDGFENTLFKDPFVHIFGYRFDDSFVERITGEIEMQYAGFKKRMENWKKGRDAEIQEAEMKYK